MGRIALVGMWQETNTYSPRPTGLPDFEVFELLEGEAIIERHAGTGSVIGGFLEGLGGDEPVGVLSAGAWPAAPPDPATTAALLGRLEAALERAPDVDGVLVNLHGAMVAAGADDMEEATLARIRRRFGTVPVAVVLDLHANPSITALRHCDAAIGYRTYPHDDMAACGAEAAGIVRLARDERLVTVAGRLPLLTSPIGQATVDRPMAGLLQRAEARAARARVLRVSLLAGFPYSDVERAGFTVLAVAAESDAEAARDVVARTLDDVAAHAGEFARDLPRTAEAVRRGLAAPRRPVVLADVADNIGGGAPGDGTAILAELIAQRARDAVVLLVDAPAVAAAHAAGDGAQLDLCLGAFADDLHGTPLRVRACVQSTGDGRYRTAGPYMTGQEFAMGRTAVLAVAGVRVLSMERATPPFHVEQLTANGIDPAGASIIAVKGAVAWRAPYRGVAQGAIEVDTPGCCPADPTRLTRRHPPLPVPPTVLGALGSRV
jgi:microcystin degradation protein MlrC